MPPKRNASASKTTDACTAAGKKTASTPQQMTVAAAADSVSPTLPATGTSVVVPKITTEKFLTCGRFRGTDNLSFFYSLKGVKSVLKHVGAAVTTSPKQVTVVLMPNLVCNQDAKAKEAVKNGAAVWTMAGLRQAVGEWAAATPLPRSHEAWTAQYGPEGFEFTVTHAVGTPTGYIRVLTYRTPAIGAAAAGSAPEAGEHHTVVDRRIPGQFSAAPAKDGVGAMELLGALFISGESLRD